MTRKSDKKTLIVTLLVVAVSLAGCGGGPLARTRTLLARGDLAGAVGAAGESWVALRAVSLEVLADALRRPETREAAAETVLSAGAAALPLAGRLVGSDDALSSTVGAALLVASGAEGSAAAAALLRERVGDEDAAVRAVAVRAGCGVADESACVERALDDEDATVRLAALRVLSRGALAGDEGLVARLVECARGDRSDRVRASAIRGLGRLAPTVAIDEVIDEALASDVATIRLAAVEALAPRGGAAEIAARLRGVAQASDDAASQRAVVVLAIAGAHDARERLAEALRRGDPQAASVAAVGAAQVGPTMIDALLAAVERPEGEVRLRAAAALVALGRADAARPALSRLLDDPGWVGLQAALLLARDGDLAALGRVAEATSSLEVDRRVFVAAACVGLPRGLDVARAGLSDPAAAVRLRAAASVLRYLGRRA